MISLMTYEIPRHIISSIYAFFMSNCYKNNLTYIHTREVKWIKRRFDRKLDMPDNLFQSLVFFCGIVMWTSKFHDLTISSNKFQRYKWRSWFHRWHWWCAKTPACGPSSTPRVSIQTLQEVPLTTSSANLQVSFS